MVSLLLRKVARRFPVALLAALGVKYTFATFEPLVEKQFSPAPHVRRLTFPPPLEEILHDPHAYEIHKYLEDATYVP